MSTYNLYLKMTYDYSREVPVGGWAYIIDDEESNSYYDFGALFSEVSLNSITASVACYQGIDHILELCEGDITNLTIKVFSKDANFRNWTNPDSKTKVAGGIAVNEMFKDFRSKGINLEVMPKEVVNEPYHFNTINDCTKWSSKAAYGFEIPSDALQ